MTIISKLKIISKSSSAQSHVATYILNNETKILNMNTRELAEKSFVSPATIIRLCQNLKTSGFLDFKIKLAVELDIDKKNKENILKNYELYENDTNEEIANKLFSINYEGLSQTKQLIDFQKINESLDLIDNAFVVDLYGTGFSGLLAQDFYYKFLRLNKLASVHLETDNKFINAKLSNKDHVAIIISHTGETKEMIKVAELLKKNETKIITITTSDENTLKSLGDVNLCVSNYEKKFRITATSSRTGMFYLMDILFSLYISRDYYTRMNLLAETFIEKNQEVL